MFEVALLITMYCCTDPLQGGDTPLYLAARERLTTCVEHLLSTPGIEVDTAFQTIYF